jgi:flavin-dependent dehydrogenase
MLKLCSRKGFAFSDSRSARPLENGSRIAVIGGGPAGSFFSYFLLDMAARAGLQLHVEIYEMKDFRSLGASGCNMCGGIISESLVQLLATEGINLPPSVVQRGIDSYRLHMDVGSVTIATPMPEARIAAVHRGGGPRGTLTGKWESFDGYLLDLARQKGAIVTQQRVEDFSWSSGLPRVIAGGKVSEPYDLLVVAAGVNSGARKLVEKLGDGRQAPRTVRTAICDIRLGADVVHDQFGSSMHVFLLNVPRLEVAAIIPKGEYITVVLLGDNVDKDLVSSFLNAPEVRACFPSGWSTTTAHCRCSPAINVRGPAQPFADRLVFIGDCSESRLYKDGIGGAYRTAKAAARTALFHGVSAKSFQRHYLPVCRRLALDNSFGKVIFAVSGILQRMKVTRQGLLRMVEMEQTLAHRRKRMSSVLWDAFTGSTPYRDVFWRTLHPPFVARLFLATANGLLGGRSGPPAKAPGENAGELGRSYLKGATILKQGDTGDAMFVIQSGSVEVLCESGGHELCIAELGKGEIFGEMALFEHNTRTTTVRALSEVRVLSVDRRVLLRSLHEDPSLAFRIMSRMAGRITDLSKELMDQTRARLNDALGQLENAAAAPCSVRDSQFPEHTPNSGRSCCATNTPNS